MHGWTFLTREQIYGDKPLDIIKKCGTKAAITDFSILLGGDVSSEYFTHEGDKLKDRIGCWWTKTPFLGNVIGVACSGHEVLYYVTSRIFGARPAIAYSSISYGTSNEKTFLNGPLHGLKEVEFGEYPQMVADIDISHTLENSYLNCCLKKTGKTYTADFNGIFATRVKFNPRTYTEYEYNGEKYIRFVGDSNCEAEKLSDGRIVESGSPYWVKVEPIKWLVDDKAGIVLSKKILFAGVQFKNTDTYDGNFLNTDISEFMDTYFSKEILTAKVTNKKILVENDRKHNPYNFDYSEVTEEEIIRGAVESNVAVFLHGRSSEGKSARVKQIDPDLEIIYLRNATPDSLNGKSVFNSETNEMIDIPPTWYKKVVDKCVSEPDKIHIIFFDEITNALPSIQGMAFNIVLNGEVNGKWKLPENARIVAAGNDLEESKAANEMAEPLFNRFAHVYINTTVDSWLKWASTPDEEYERLDYTPTEKHPKIHPAIYAYIAYKSYSKQDVLRTPYNGKTPNADPRKWEMSSKVLYKTNKPEMLRALIGEDLTRDFAMFCSKQVLSVEDVINGNYTEENLDMDVSEKFNTAVGLSSVTEEHIEVVRDFVMKLGPEICATFDTLWVHGDESRLEKIAEIKLSERTK